MSGSGQLQKGRPDHDHHGWDPLPFRTAMEFANGKALGICPVISFETHEDKLPPDWPQPNWMAGGVGLRPDPNIARIGQRDYGLRAGWPRLRHAILQAGLSYAAAMDVLTAERRPDLVAQIGRDVAQGRAEWVAHGLSVNRPIHDAMTIDLERAYIAEAKDRLLALQINPTGWHGIEYGESRRTPALLAEAGYNYTLDWCSDEQPFAMTVPHGQLTALPQMADLDDGFAFAAPRGITPESYAERIEAAGRQLAIDGRKSARVMLWHMRPFLSGQPFRIAGIERALMALGSLQEAYSATPSKLLCDIRLEGQTP
jgi:hypothetical protein